MTSDAPTEISPRRADGPQDLPPPSRAFEHLKAKIEADPREGLRLNNIRKLLRKGTGRL